MEKYLKYQNSYQGRRYLNTMSVAYLSHSQHVSDTIQYTYDSADQMHVAASHVMEVAAMTTGGPTDASLQHLPLVIGATSIVCYTQL